MELQIAILVICNSWRACMFIGRSEEIKRLKAATNKKTASFIVIKGRRRIGKSRLAEEFGWSFDHCYRFSGLPPTEETTHQKQLDEFSRQFSANFKAPFSTYQDWTDALWAVAERVKKGKILVIFDEISWMGSKDPDFLGKIKNIWDLYFKKNDRLVFIVCGSASSWIEKNIMSSTGFVGRISFTITLEELSLQESREFWPANISAYEILKILSITGGVPKYLEEINPKLSAEENIKQLCFTKGGFLVKEFDQIFSDVFLRDSAMYKNIVKTLNKGSKEISEMQTELKLATPGRLTEYLWELELAGFITRDFTWDLKTGNDAKLSRYRLTDNYTRFYLRYIEKNISKIERNNFTFKNLSLLPEWSIMIALQFENLILKNRSLLYKALNIKPEEIVSENPYFQRATLQRKGCQVDYMIQTKFDTLYVCEIKFMKQEIGVNIIDEMKTKISALHRHRRFSCRPVLIHVNGVTADVIESDYFAAIINIADFLNVKS